MDSEYLNYGTWLRSVSADIFSDETKDETKAKVAVFISKLEKLHEHAYDQREMYMQVIYEHIIDISEVIRMGHSFLNVMPEEHIMDSLMQHGTMAEYVAFIGPEGKALLPDQIVKPTSQKVLADLTTTTDLKTRNRYVVNMRIHLLMKYTRAHLNITLYMLAGLDDDSDYKNTFVPFLRYCLDKLQEYP
ncbi:hypothetical protein BGW36DRAFT_430688 [Talaromyces proteolyticus]|uniref:Uncharacterized protein n=1 Tax=Talaromyces proteolyticus TaxID=1131652 RepID=A0AAD4KJK1_9EURO|nr:uncharacterized protein BGW36DRAFT_430688 [Talaromyces proteolyticus]KAH8692945.1 hypothetical protein BGW36DRAFT_430688 [Talaromyces proteolyticus]